MDRTTQSAAPCAARRRLLTLPAGVLLAGVAPAPVRASSAPASVAQAIDAAARDLLAQSGAPGLAVGVVTPAGEQLFFHGVASRETGRPVDGRTLFEVGSLSKTLTAALAARAAEAGALQWDDPPSRHLPELRGTALDGVTLLDLATHTTGGMPLQLPDAVRTDADLLGWFRAWVPAAPPGSVRTYANPSIGLLGLVAARALGGDFGELVRERVSAPLGLRRTFHDLPGAEMEHYAQGHTRDGRPVRVSAAPLWAEAYGVRMTAGDLLRFVAAQMETVSADSALRQALAATRVGHFQAGPLTQALIWEWYPPPVAAGDLAAGNGEAMVLRPNPVSRLDPPRAPPAGARVNKTGATNGFGAYAAFVPGDGVGFVVLANRNHPTGLRLAFAERVFAALDGRGAPERR